MKMEMDGEIGVVDNTRWQLGLSMNSRWKFLQSIRRQDIGRCLLVTIINAHLSNLGLRCECVEVVASRPHPAKLARNSGLGMALKLPFFTTKKTFSFFCDQLNLQLH